MKTDGKDQMYVWHWYVDDGSGLSGPHRTRQSAIDDVPEWVEEFKIVMGKSRMVNLETIINDDFADNLLRLLINSSDEAYSSVPDPSRICSEEQKHDLAEQLKSTILQWQVKYGIGIPDGGIIETKTDSNGLGWSCLSEFKQFGQSGRDNR